ncbi:MAG: PqiC family protein [Desulfohalobiaceae bacterium]|nr:PqiC family protein [Desulfohalobiaceae bacterium]
MSHMAFFRPFLLFLGILFFVGCTASQPTSFYVLTAKTSGGGSEGSMAQSEACPHVELGPVSFPEYLDRSEMVTRVGPNRLSLSELHHWAEPLRENFVRVLRANLNSRLCGGNIAVFPERKRARSDYRLSLDVHRFESLERDRALLIANWTFRDTQSGKALRTRRAVYKPPVKGADHQAVAAAMSKALASLSRDIADSLLEITKEPAPN